MSVIIESTHGGEIYNITFSHLGAAHFQAIVPLMKNLIPSSHRSYDPKSKKWEVSKEYIEAIRAAITALGIVIAERREYPSLEEIRKNFFYEAPKPPSALPKESLHSKLTAILAIDVASLSDAELRKVYRKKALELHPDRNNGDGSRMSELNSLWSAYNAK